MRRLIILWAYFLGTFIWAQTNPDVLTETEKGLSLQENMPALNLIQQDQKLQPQKQESKNDFSDEKIIDEQEAKRVEKLYEEAPAF